MTRVALGDPALADVKLLSGTQLRVVGLKPGKTDLTVWSKSAPDGRSYHLVIGPNVAALNDELSRIPALRTVTAISDPIGVTLEGQVASMDAQQESPGAGQCASVRRVSNQVGWY